MNVLRAFIVSFMLALAACVPANADAARTTPLQQAQAATVRLDFESGICSGTVIGPRAILTATHCFRSAGALQVNNKPVAILKRVDDGNDHTIIWVDRTYTHIAKLAGRPAIQGEFFRIWGNPGGLRNILREGRMVGWNGEEGEVRLTLFDLNVFLGDSGSGIFNDRGQLVDVLSGLLNLSDQRSYAKLAAALPLNFKAADLASAVKSR